MPKSHHRPKVTRCVQQVQGKDPAGDKGRAIRICQASLGESYKIPKAERQVKREGGKKLKALRKQQAKSKAEKIAARRERLGWNEGNGLETEAQSLLRLFSTLNAFCATGEKGGKDNSCSSKEGGKGATDLAQSKRAESYWKATKTVLPGLPAGVKAEYGHDGTKGVIRGQINVGGKTEAIHGYKEKSGGYVAFGQSETELGQIGPSRTPADAVKAAYQRHIKRRAPNMNQLSVSELVQIINEDGDQISGLTLTPGAKTRTRSKILDRTSKKRRKRRRSVENLQEIING